MDNAHSSTKPISVALLSATGMISQGSGNAPNDPTIELPLVSQQIDHLRDRGVMHFFIEIESVSGALVALADRLQKKSVLLDFVRSPQELAGKMDGQSLLFIQSEGVLASEPLLTELLASTRPLVATLDGRDENAKFERIDLNTRWTGLAVIDRRTIDSIAALPLGYSIASSLLRQALQDKITNKTLKQDVIQSGALHKICNVADFKSYAILQLSQRTKATRGFLENRIGGPLGKWLAPRIWQSRHGQKILDGFTLGSALISFAAGYGGFNIAAAAFGILSILGITLSNIVQETDNDTIKMAAVAPATWTVLCGALGMMLWQDHNSLLDNLFSFLILSGLLLLTMISKSLTWTRFIMPSPAFAGLVLFVFSVVGEAIVGAKLLAILLIGLLIAAHIKPQIRE